MDNICASAKNSEKQDFATLTDIMERFHKVPFEVFQQELRVWFKTGFAEIEPKFKGVDECRKEDFLKRLLEIGDIAFKQADQASNTHDF